MKKANRGIVPIIIIAILVILLIILAIAYIEVQNNRNGQISTFRQFTSNNDLPLTTGSVHYTNIVTLGLSDFEQKCLTLSTQPNFAIYDQQTNNWLIFPQEKFTVIDNTQGIAYQWIV